MGASPCAALSPRAANVVIADVLLSRRGERSLRTWRSARFITRLDVTSENDCGNLRGAAEDADGPVSGLVNNAGYRALRTDCGVRGGPPERRVKNFFFSTSI